MFQIGLIFLFTVCGSTEHRRFNAPFNQYGRQTSYYKQNWIDDTMIKEVRVNQGRLKGFVVQPKTNPSLQMVDVFLGIPYAEPPIGSLRFAPPRSPQPWRDVRSAEKFAPVCPQILPDVRLEVKPGRHEYLERLLPYLKNQSEDCLYLNIYAPHQSDDGINSQKHPVMVFIHGESFNWNSGNPYDGTILAAYANVVFVTINFRLGILGFLRPGISDDAPSNFGIFDQIAALVWIKENIAKFGGDPDSVTLVGHGTGAILTNLLLLSPVVNNTDLFKRAILMSGSALSADAIGKAPLQITTQVAYGLNCPITNDNELASCLRNRDVESLLNVRIDKPRYVPAFAPLIDRALIPKKPIRLMENVQQFGSFDLMYGVTESEKFHILPPVAALHGMLDGQRDEVLRDHAKVTHELEPELILSKILEHYGSDFLKDYSDEYPTINRDIVLDALSDSGTVAPLVMTGRLHAKANPKSYMYVFSHPRAMQDYSGQQRMRTVHGEELPYIFGVPLDNSKYHLDRYNIGETLFSEAMMTWWTNFAYTGNPNAPGKMSFMTDGPKEWRKYQVIWPEFNLVNETYFNLTIFPKVGRKYRSSEMKFWNEDVPNLIKYNKLRVTRPEFLDRADGIGKYENNSFNENKLNNHNPNEITNKQIDNEDFDFTSSIDHKMINKFNPYFNEDNNNKKFKNNNGLQSNEDILKGSSVITMVIGFGVVFLIINITAFFYFYHKRNKIKQNNAATLANKIKTNKMKSSDKTIGGGGSKKYKTDNNVTNTCQKFDSKVDINDVIKNDKAYDNNSNFGRQSKLSRHNSNSTIDTHIKVKEWIQQEIVHRCSPRFLRKTRETLQKEHQEKLEKQLADEEEEERKKEEEENVKNPNLEPIYDQSPELVVRPGGKKIQFPKVSVGIDATPATRTDSILNQVPIEFIKDLNRREEPNYQQQEVSNYQVTPQIVVIEHHHSRSDPLPMDSVLKNYRQNFSTIQRPSDSDSGSASSLYAKINPKIKPKLFDLEMNKIKELPSRDVCDGNEIYDDLDEGIYGRIPKMKTFGQLNDINVTSKEPSSEIEKNLSPEEALKTIKRRNYPKVLPDIEKRRSLPVQSNATLSKQINHPIGDQRKGLIPTYIGGCPPQPPPRIFGTSKSLDLPEEDEKEPVTTNLHIGPLLKRQDSCGKNPSDPYIINSIEQIAIDAQEVLLNHQNESSELYSSLLINPICPMHKSTSGLSDKTRETSCTSKSVDNLDQQVKNQNWYKDLNHSDVNKQISNKSLPNVNIVNQNSYQLDNNNLKNSFNDSTDNNKLNQINETSRFIKDSINTDRKEPKIVIVPVNQIKQPKIIIKPSANTQKKRERNIPKVSAIPTPSNVQNQQTVADNITTTDVHKDKPAIKEKPKFTRIPSFSKKTNHIDSDDMSSIYAEKVEIVQRVNFMSNNPISSDDKSNLPTLKRELNKTKSSVDSNNLSFNTNTLKKKCNN